MKLTTKPSRNNEAMIRIAPRAESNKRRPSVDPQDLRSGQPPQVRRLSVWILLLSCGR